MIVVDVGSTPLLAFQDKKEFEAFVEAHQWPQDQVFTVWKVTEGNPEKYVIETKLVKQA